MSLSGKFCVCRRVGVTDEQNPRWLREGDGFLYAVQQTPLLGLIVRVNIEDRQADGLDACVAQRERLKFTFDEYQVAAGREGTKLRWNVGPRPATGRLMILLPIGLFVGQSVAAKA